MKTTRDKFDLYEQMVYLIFWLIVVIFPVLNEAFEGSAGHDFLWRDIFRWWMGMIPFFVVFLLHDRIMLQKLLFSQKTRAYVFCLILTVVVFGGFQKLLLEYGQPHHVPGMRPAPPSGPGHPGPHHPDLFFFFGISAPVLVNVLFLIIVLGFNLAVSSIFRYQNEKEKMKSLETMRLHDELKYLKAQINPHFFMNMLNNIHAMVEVDSGKAQEMILELSKLMRYVLYEGDNFKTSFASEVRFLSSYLTLMRRRYPEGKVNVSFEVPENPSEELCIPPLLFIAFVENAFKHGVSYRSLTEIRIVLEETDGNVRFRCWNTRPESGSGEVTAGGVGLENACRRLELLYGDRYSLDIESNNKEYNVTLTIPCL